MPLVVTSVPNLAQGVSQQPDNLRYPGQCDEQINAWATVVEGLVKRPNTRWINEFNSGATPTNLFTHFVKRDEQNKYCVTVSLGGVGVINLEDGTNYPVSISTFANQYLSLGTSVTNPLADLRALTVADYTFLVNKNRTVAKSTAKSKPLDKEALIAVKLGDYNKYYSVYIDDLLVPWSTIHGSEHNPGSFPASYVSGSGNQSADTEHIAQDLGLLIDNYFNTTSTGITDITITNPGAGYASLALLALQGGEYSNFIAYELRVTIEQYNTAGELVGTGAKGLADIAAGQVQSITITNKGSGYLKTTDTGYTAPIVTFQEYGYRWQKWETWNTWTTQATATATVADVQPIKVVTKGSVIKLTRTSYVENDGYYYKCIQDHTSSSTTEPGTGADWEEYWESWDKTDLADDWATSTDYTIGTDFSVRVSDGLSDQGLDVIYKEVASITDLPKKCYNNFRVKVAGDADIDQDDYYVKFSTKDKLEFGEGSWVEVHGWYQNDSPVGEAEALEIGIDQTTMPVTLVPVFTGDDITSFKLQSPEEEKTVKAKQQKGWRTRDAGDDETNPFPSFVGTTINDVFFFKNRLGFLTDSNVIFSEADEYYNFFRTTTQQLLDSAPIDVGLSHTKVAVLQHALPFQEKLMLFSDNSQFVLRGADVLSPKTVAISPVTEYDISDGIAPLALGPYIYFPFKRGQFEGMFEYFVDNNTEVFEAEEITSQIPKYIPSKIKQMAGSASESMVLLQNATDAKTLYVYKYFWSGKEKIQSAWQKWTFDDDVTGFDFIDSTLYLILNGKVLVEMPVENAITDTGLDYTLLLDNRVDGAGKTVSYNEQTNRTTISGLPTGYGATVDNMTVFTKGGSERNVVASASGTSVEIEGFIASYVKHSGTIYKCVDTHTSSSSDTPGVSAKWTVSTDLPNAPTWSDAGILYNDENYFVVGKPYNMLYRFSNQALKQPTERGGRSASDYTYQTIRNASIEYADTGHFTVEVTSRFRDTYSYVYNPAVLSSISTLDRFTPESGHFRFGVQCRPEEATIEVKSSSALPVKLLAAEFESMVTGRSKRYGA